MNPIPIKYKSWTGQKPGPNLNGWLLSCDDKYSSIINERGGIERILNEDIIVDINYLLGLSRENKINSI